ncbi:hypothetical protein [Pseudophaeobacter sp.]
MTEIKAFQIPVKRRMPKMTKEEKETRKEIIERTNGMIAGI